MSSLWLDCASQLCYRDADGVLQPRRARDGLYLCSPCTASIGANARRAAELHDELAERLVSPGTGGGGTKSANKPSSKEPDDSVLGARWDIATSLDRLSALVAVHRGITPPSASAMQRAAFITLHADWLAARKEAGYICEQLADLAWGRSRATAYPAGSRKYPITWPSGSPAMCPEPGCPEQLWAVLRRDDSAVPSELACAAEEPHSMPSTLWLAYGRKLYEGAPA